MRLTFLGGTATVTGSKYVLEHDGQRLLVDCGLFQGLKKLRLRNWDELPVAAVSVDAVVLTHAHLDHSGFVPRLVRLGFRGPVHCSPATGELCGLLWPDSGHLMERESEYANRHGYSRHHPALPLYDEAEARRALERLRPIDFGTRFTPLPGMQVSLSGAGHILGAASVHVEWERGSILFSGDLGRQHDLLMRAPHPPPACDTLVVESTYGDRLHPREDVLGQLAAIINRTAARGGTVIVPAFAVGRAQLLLLAIDRLKQAARIPNLPVYLNSPMAANATELYRRHAGEHRLDAAQCAALGRAAKIVNSVEESVRLNEARWPSIIVSASGMASGGRVLHHLKAMAPDPRHTILFVGFQAAGTRGSSMVAGAPAVKLLGQWVDVRAEVVNLASLSAHADREELLAWIAALPRPPRRVFVTHGEPQAADALRQAVEERWRWHCEVPDYLDSVDLDS